MEGLRISGVFMAWRGKNLLVSCDLSYVFGNFVELQIMQGCKECDMIGWFIWNYLLTVEVLTSRLEMRRNGRGNVRKYRIDWTE